MSDNENKSQSSLAKSLAVIFLCIVAFFGIWAYGVMAYGYALSVLWGWFVSSPFNLPSIGWAHGAGLIALVRFLTISYSSIKNNDESEQTNSVKVAFFAFAPWVSIFFGWIITQLM